MPTLGSSRSVLASADVQTILDFEGKLAQRSLLLFGLGITLALSSTACGDSSGPKELAACEAGVPLSVGTGLTPVFSWAPDCTALTLYVKTSEGPQGAGANNTVWAIQVPPDSQGAVANRIRSGVTYVRDAAGRHRAGASDRAEKRGSIHRLPRGFDRWRERPGGSFQYLHADVIRSQFPINPSFKPGTSHGVIAREFRVE